MKTKYLIVSNYCDYETDMCGNEIETEDGPFAAILQDCAQMCNIQLHEAASYLENQSWSLIVFVHDDEGSRRIPWREQGFPWQRINDLRGEITEIEEGLKQAEGLEKLFALPGMDSQQLDVNLTPAREHLENHRRLLTEAQTRWAKMLEAPGGGKEQRSIQVDAPASAE